MIVPGAKYWNMGFGRLPGEVAEDIEGVENFKSFAANVLKGCQANEEIRKRIPVYFSHFCAILWLRCRNGKKYLNQEK